MRTTVLQTIAESVAIRLNQRKRLVSQLQLEKLLKTARVPQDFSKAFLSDSTNIIAEVKFKSPSQGFFAVKVDPLKVASEYLSNGACALSVLTEEDHFNGRLEYLKNIRARFHDSFLLMKDFIIDEYQILEAIVNGADSILLIVALLGEEKCDKFLGAARKLGLSALVEVHNEAEMNVAKNIGASIIGINNRDLKTLDISLDTSRQLAPQAPRGAVLICESGIESQKEIEEMKALGFHGFLVGTSLMKSGNPGLALSGLLKGIKK